MNKEYVLIRKDKLLSLLQAYIYVDCMNIADAAPDFLPNKKYYIATMLNKTLQEVEKNNNTFRDIAYLELSKIILGNRIREARENANYTIEDAAKALNYSTSRIEKYENGDLGMDSKVLISFSNLYKVPCKDLLTAFEN